MFRSRAGVLWFLGWVGLVFLSLRPVAAVERGLDLALAPLRFAAELAWPLSLLRARAVAAAERDLARSAAVEAAEGAGLVADLAARALPSDPDLLAGRRFLPGEVIARLGEDRDRCRVAVRDLRGIEPGCPVACGEAYVGRVVEVPGEPAGPAGAVLVELVTAPRFRVGALVRGDEEVFLTAGGLFLPSRSLRERSAPRLAVHQPSSSSLAAGLARVHELFAEEGEHAALAEGLWLGQVHREGERGPWWVEPELDYEDGLFQVAIATRSDPEEADAPAPETALSDPHWCPTRALSAGDPSPWRSTVKVPVGWAHGVQVGAAVTGAGARLVGRVARASALASDVALLADPGLSLVAVARVEGEDEPRVLGRLVSLGRGEAGSIRFRWSARLSSSAGGAHESVRARLFSGSGDAGLPSGLFLGEAWLPGTVASGEELEIELAALIDPADVRTLFVRLPAPSSAVARP